MRETRIYRGDIAPLILPEHLANWDVHDYWEREVYDSMAALREDDECLWVIGAEHGYLAAVWSRLFAGRTVLIEPSPPFWRNIRLTWHANELPVPVATVQAFMGARSQGKLAPENVSVWPASAAGDEECPAQEYRYLFNEKHVKEIPTTTVDRLVALGVPVPTSLTCDTEGAEVLILQGAKRTLKKHSVKLWLSVHPDLIERDYADYDVEHDVFDFLGELGYTGKHLATDHEEHWLFTK